MNRIIQILIKNHVFFLFIILEFISFQLLIANNFVVESKVFKKITEIRSSFFLKEAELKEYFLLKEHNANLLNATEILSKKNELLKQKLNLSYQLYDLDDTTLISQAKVIKNSWLKKQNFITINKGKLHNIENNMGVANHSGLIGITYSVSENFTTIISLINTNLMISAKIKGTGSFGTLSWNGRKHNQIQLTGIPKHVDIKIGDTIVTSGYSNILPEEIEVGKIISFQNEKNTNFLEIQVAPFVDFTSINYVHILNRLNKKERMLIEKNR